MTQTLGFSGLPVCLMHWFQKRASKKSTQNLPKTPNYKSVDSNTHFIFPPPPAPAPTPSIEEKQKQFQSGEDMKSMDKGLQAINQLLLSVVGRVSKI